VRDTVRAYQLILERGRPGHPYNVCSGRAIPIRELLDLLIAARACGRRESGSRRATAPNDTPILLGNPARLRDELGWTAEIPMEQTLDDLLEYWRRKTP
jgi:GDP-4-dehydro-6-deoxy-D-mannose reductase